MINYSNEMAAAQCLKQAVGASSWITESEKSAMYAHLDLLYTEAQAENLGANDASTGATLSRFADLYAIIATPSKSPAEDLKDLVEAIIEG